MCRQRLTSPHAHRQGTTRPLYIRDLGREMAKLANDANDASLDLLAYLLSLVVLEAESLNASELVAGPDDSPPQD
jgi:hypothetical protein